MFCVSNVLLFCANVSVQIDCDLKKKKEEEAKSRINRIEADHH